MVKEYADIVLDKTTIKGLLNSVIKASFIDVESCIKELFEWLRRDPLMKKMLTNKLQVIQKLPTISYPKLAIYDNLAHSLAKLNAYYNLYVVQSKIPSAVYEDRKLFKSAIMTSAYCAGTKSRTEGFVEYIRDTLSKRGYSSIDEEDITNIAHSLENYFKYIILIKLPQISTFISNCYDYLKGLERSEGTSLPRSKPIKITMPYLSWYFVIYTKVLKRFKAFFNNNVRHFAIQVPTSTIDKEQMGITFPSILVQGIDGFTVHYYLEIINEVNKVLYEMDPTIPQDETIEKGYVIQRENLESPIKYHEYKDYYEDNNYFYDDQIGTYTWDSDFYDVPNLTNVRDFVDVQSDATYLDDTPYFYNCIERPIARKEYCNKYNIKTSRLLVTQYEPPYDAISKELAIEFHRLMPFAIDLSIFLKQKDRDKYEDIIKLEILIIFGYFICWSYILIVSFHTLSITDILDLLENTYKHVDGPF